MLNNIISIKTAKKLAITQGYSDQGFTVINRSSKPVTINLGHAHGYLTLDPRSDTLPPGASRDITVHIDDFCPSGKVDLLLYVLAESEKEEFGMEAITLEFEVLPGTLTLAEQDNKVMVVWNGNPAPPGVIIYYRNSSTDDETWKLWGETPNLYPPGNLLTGTYLFEFKAKLSNVESEIYKLEIYVEQVQAGYQPRTVPRSSESSKVAARQPEKSDELDSGDLVHVVRIIELPEGSTIKPAEVIFDPPPVVNSNPLILF